MIKHFQINITGRDFAVGDIHGHFTKLQAENDALRKSLGGMLFAFDDGVGREWSADLLDHARKLCPAAEFTP